MIFSPLFWYVYFGITAWRQAIVPRNARPILSKCPSSGAELFEPAIRLLTPLLSLLGHHWTVLLLTFYCPSSWLDFTLSFATFWTPGAFLPLNPSFIIALLIDFLHFCFLLKSSDPITVSNCYVPSFPVCNTLTPKVPFSMPISITLPFFLS